MLKDFRLRYFCFRYILLKCVVKDRAFFPQIILLIKLLESCFKPLTAGAAYIWIFIFYWQIKYHLLNMLKIKCDINQQDLKTVDLHFSQI